MPVFKENIVELARQNEYFRREVSTSEHSQVVVMSLQPGEDIGEETHDVDQILVFVEGQGVAILNGQRSEIATNHMVVVPAGTRHNFVATGTAPLKLFTIYAPPEEAPGTLHRTRDEAVMAVPTTQRPAALE